MDRVKEIEKVVAFSFLFALSLSAAEQLITKSRVINQNIDDSFISFDHQTILMKKQ